MPDWINNPRYQRVIQKLQGLPSWQRAIFTSAGADRAFASEEMRNKIAAINAAIAKKGRVQAISTAKDRLALERERFGAGTRLADKYRKAATKDRRLAEYLGYGNVALSGALGYQDMQLANLQAIQEQADRKKILEYMGRGGAIQ